VLGQLGNRVQHALRAFTPSDQKAVRAAAETFRPNPKLKVEEAITQLEVGQALVSFLDEKGTPGMVERAYILPPRSQIGPVTQEQRQETIKASAVYGTYEKEVDRDSAYEILKSRAEQSMQTAPAPQPKAPRPAPASRRQTVAEAAVKSAARAAAGQVGRQLVRGILGSLFRK